MKRYIHNKTGKEAKEVADGYDIGETIIPKWLVEDSPDWDKVKSKPFLFISSDDFEICKGDSCYYIDSSFGISDIIINEQTLHPDQYFYHKSNAEQYVLMNFPSLCLNDVQQVFGTDMKPEIRVLYEKLRSLANQRALQNL